MALKGRRICDEGQAGLGGTSLLTSGPSCAQPSSALGLRAATANAHCVQPGLCHLTHGPERQTHCMWESPLMTLSLPGPDYERAVLDLQITLPDIPSVSHRPRYLSLTPY